MMDRWLAVAAPFALAMAIAGCSNNSSPGANSFTGGAGGDTAEGDGSAGSGGDAANDGGIEFSDVGGGGKDTGGNNPADTASADTGEAPSDADSGNPDVSDDDGSSGTDCENNQDCDDGNPCTKDVCGNLGCANVPVPGGCDDGNPCTTGDGCTNGACKGAPMTCDDGDPCTTNACVDGQCTATPVTQDPACAPSISVSYPPRGAVLYGNTEIPVEGIVASPASPITQVTVNGKPVTLSAQGEFATALDATYGLNIITIVATSATGATDKVVQAFSFGDTVHPVATPEDGATLPDSAGLWLDKSVFDDNNFQDLDDLSTVAKLVLEELDLQALLPNPLTSPADGIADFLWCSWTVTIPLLTYDIGEVDLVPIPGGLGLYVQIVNFSAAFQAIDDTIGCPDLIGTATAESMDIEAQLLVTVANGALTADLQDIAVAFNGVDIELTSGIAIIANGLLDYFETELVATVEGLLADWLPSYLLPTLNELIGELVNYDLEIEIPSFTSTGEPVKVQFWAEPSGAVFSNAGGAIALNLGAASAKKIDMDAPGSFARGKCGAALPKPPAPPPASKSCVGKCGSQSSDGSCYCDAACLGYGDCCADSCQACGYCLPNLDQFPWQQTAQVEAVVHEDLANQILFALWWGGGMNLFLTDTELSQFRTTAALSGVELELVPYMAPIVTTCTSDQKLELQLGDIFIDTSFEYSGLAVDLEAYASVRVEVAVVVEPPDSGKANQIGLQFVKLEAFDYQLVSVQGLGAGGETVVEALLSEELISFVVENYLAGAVGAFPLPAIDLGSFVPGVPAGSNILFNPTKLALDSGYLEITGKIEAP